MTNVPLDAYDIDFMNALMAESTGLEAQLRSVQNHQERYVNTLLRKAGVTGDMRYRISPDGKMLVPVEPPPTPPDVTTKHGG